jgi:hypothetical protein
VAEKGGKKWGKKLISPTLASDFFMLKEWNPPPIYRGWKRGILSLLGTNLVP